MYKILHITTHLGAGIGSTVLNYLIKNTNGSSFYQEVVCLGYATKSVIEKAKELKIKLKDNMHKNHKEILQMIPEFDIILIHQWNHPLLYDFLVRNELPSCRLIMWGHTSGFYAPNIHTKKLLTYPDLFVFTSPLSYKTKDYLELTEQEKKKIYNIWSTGTVDHVKNVKPKKHDGFIVGYIGTVDYGKMHRNFLEMSISVHIPNVKFIVVGGIKHREIEKESKEYEGHERFEFKGWVPEINNYLEIFDVFGYPLHSTHFGTCDLALQEALACGIVPVVFNNMMESFIVKDGVTGIVVNDEAEYVEAIEELYYNKELRKKLSDNAKKDAVERFSLKHLRKEWTKVFNDIIKIPKTKKKWNINKKSITAKDVFLESLGDYGKDFGIRLEEFAQITSWKAETKGTVHNYYTYFPNDKTLAYWSDRMRELQ